MDQAFLPPIFCALTSFFAERHQHLVAHRGLGHLRLRPSLHLHHLLHVHHLRIPAVRGIRSGLHDLFALHNFWRAEPSLGQNVREHRPALVADNRGHRRYYHGACTIHPVQIWPQGAGYEQTCPEQGLETMVWFAGHRFALGVRVRLRRKKKHGRARCGIFAEKPRYQHSVWC